MIAAPVSADDTRDYNSFLREVMSLARLPYLEEGTISRQFSSYNRTKMVCPLVGE